MLNEVRVKHMVKLALSETKNGKEKLEAGSYYKKDYIVFHVLWSVIWMTVGYAALMLLLGITAMTLFVEQMSTTGVTIGVLLAIGVYIGLLITYIMVTRKFYSRKHARAYQETTKFKSDLAELEIMYEKEDIDGEVI